jgi:DNA-directed RNA polymerase specialized sigma24 family protein
MLDDRQLLRRYATDGSEAAFGELVGRHLNLVYSAALRRTGGDIHLAQDVAQLVFTDLARKARALPADAVLAGWLHRATHYAAAQLLRTERRRVAREQEAVAMNTPDSNPFGNKSVRCSMKPWMDSTPPTATPYCSATSSARAPKKSAKPSAPAKKPRKSG